MSFMNIIKTSLTKPTKSLDNKNMNFWQWLGLALILNILLCLPLITKSLTLKDMALEDLTKASQNIPNFKITNNQLQTNKNENGVIYNGQLMTVTFDPQNKQSVSEIRKQLNHNLFGINLTPTKIYFGVNNSIAKMIPETNPLTLTYEDLNANNQSKNQLFKTFKTFINSKEIKSIFLISIFLTSFGTLITNLLIIAIAAWFYAKLSKIPMPLGATFKLCTSLSLLPIILQCCLAFFFSTSLLQTLTLILTLTLFFINVNPIIRQLNK